MQETTTIAVAEIITDDTDSSSPELNVLGADDPMFMIMALKLVKLRNMIKNDLVRDALTDLYVLQEGAVEITAKREQESGTAYVISIRLDDRNICLENGEVRTWVYDPS